MNISELAAHGTALDLALAEVRGEVKVTKLPTRKPRKEHLTANRVGGGSTRWHAAATAPRDGGSRIRRGATVER